MHKQNSLILGFRFSPLLLLDQQQKVYMNSDCRKEKKKMKKIAFGKFQEKE